MEGGGGGEGGTLHNECSLMNAAAPFLSRARFLVARLLTAFMVTRPNSRKIIYFVTTKKKTGYSLLYFIYIPFISSILNPHLHHIDFRKLFVIFLRDRVEHWPGFYRDRSDPRSDCETKAGGKICNE